MRRAALPALVMALYPGALMALDLSLPGNAVLGREVSKAADSYLLPVGPFAEGAIPTLEVEGQMLQQAWRLEAQAMTTLQMLTPLRDQLVEAGYDILLDCNSKECGGFDFRFNTRVMTAPDMFVDLFDYRFLSARHVQGEGEPDYISVLVSLSGKTGYIQVIHLAPDGTLQPTVVADAAVPATTIQPGSDLPVSQALVQQGHLILSDLRFESGSSELGAGPFISLQDLAAFLKTDADLRVALVGHTDAVGGLNPNIALSKQRAGSVLERLVSAHSVPRRQLEAEGMGYLSPIAPNLTQAGREANRRVEAVLLNSE